MPGLLGDAARWEPAATPRRAVQALATSGRFDIVHSHLTNAEAAAVITKTRHRGRIVATRHIASRRGNSRSGRLLAPIIERGISHEIAISRYVARAVGLAPDRVIHNGVATSPSLWSAESRNVVMAHRLEREKDTTTGIEAWAASQLAADGWRLLIAGTGGEAPALAEKVHREKIEGVTFLGQVSLMSDLWRQTGILLAPALAEPLGLTVLEAMAAAIPVIASAAGGHLETVLQTPTELSFSPSDTLRAGDLLRLLAKSDVDREQVGETNQRIQRAQFDIAGHVSVLTDTYDSVCSTYA
jgi:glycosyltransferase involved in cell wall biosynthesis